MVRQGAGRRNMVYQLLSLVPHASHNHIITAQRIVMVAAGGHHSILTHHRTVSISPHQHSKQSSPLYSDHTMKRNKLLNK